MDQDKDRLHVPGDKLFLTPSWKPSNTDAGDPWSLRLTAKSSSSMRRPVERKLPSLYESAQSARQFKKIYPNRVYTPWYRRYVSKLPEVESIDFQPFDEVQKNDEDIALQHFYGEDACLMDPTTDRHAHEKRKLALQRYRRVKEQEEKERASAAAAESTRLGTAARYTRFTGTAKQLMSTMESEFGATAVEMKVYSPIVDFLQKLHIGKKRLLRKIVIKRQSKWNVLKGASVLQKIRLMYKRLLQEQIHARFRKIIRLVVAVIRFIETIRFISGDTKKILREIENFMASQTQDTMKSNIYSSRKKVFDPHKYNISKELHIPFDTKMTLTKPWFTRLDWEIDMVVEALQSYKSFVQYPPMFQRRLATLAWYIEASADKYIIRERHIACDFYVLLTGKAKVVKMRGSPYIYDNGELSFIRFIKKSEGFGDESMSDPECEREYSVISTEPCALLSISVHDYLQMLSTRKEDEFAPEHIIFLCNLKLMGNFPKVKLLQEGNENITVHYFRPETVISRNLKDSNFVFVVFSGSCQLLAEVFPDIIVSQKKELYDALDLGKTTDRLAEENSGANARGHRVFNKSCKKVSSLSILSESSKDSSEVTTKQSFLSSGSEQNPSTSQATDLHAKEEHIRKSLAPGKRVHVPHIYSRWKHIRTLSRGDYTGHEWLDYRDGPYEPPEDIMSLISQGCEMVMVKKTFLLKYLRKEW